MSPSRRLPEDLETADQLPSHRVGPLRLVISTDTGVTSVALPPKASVVLGRSSEADVSIQNASVSRRHAVLHLSPGLAVEDLGSRHGTRVLGEPLRGGERRSIPVGTAFELGAVMVLLDRALARPPEPMTPSAGGFDAVVEDEAMRNLYALLEVIAPSPLSVLVLGETGSGKEVFAQALHARSNRAKGPLVKLNCAALSPSLLESELFGHEKGAFTGAVAAKPGLIESAHGGTLFLDEVGELPLELQTKLLRVVETGEVTRVGSVKPTTVDVRYVSATNVDLARAVEERRFRSDLSFRLNAFTVRLPALRERPREILPLARHFASAMAQKLGVPTPEISSEAAAVLQANEFPGNVRELKNLVERAVVLARGAPTLSPSHLRDLVAPSVADAAPKPEAPAVDASRGLDAPGPEASPTGSDGTSLRDAVSAHERERIVEALAKAGGNQTEAAKLLGISRRTLLYKLDQLQIARPRKR